jgi:5-methylcytosine-specific restriction endonuclease McrA
VTQCTEAAFFEIRQDEAGDAVRLHTATIQVAAHDIMETMISRFGKVQGNKSLYDGNWAYWSTRLGRDPSQPRRVTRLLKRQRGGCALCGLRFTTQDVIEVHHHARNHHNNAFDNLRLMHGHCHNIVHGSRCISAGLSFCDKGLYSEEPREGKALTRGSEVAAGRTTVPPTITWAAAWRFLYGVFGIIIT